MCPLIIPSLVAVYSFLSPVFSLSSLLSLSLLLSSSYLLSTANHTHILLLSQWKTKESSCPEKIFIVRACLCVLSFIEKKHIVFARCHHPHQRQRRQLWLVLVIPLYIVKRTYSYIFSFTAVDHSSFFFLSLLHSEVSKTYSQWLLLKSNLANDNRS